MIGEQFADLPSTSSSSKNLDSEMEETSLLGGVSRRSSGKRKRRFFVRFLSSNVFLKDSFLFLIQLNV